jgi:hypothetical protein
MSYSIDKVAELFALHTEVKTLDFISFMKRISEIAPPQPPKWAAVVTSNSNSTVSPSEPISPHESISGDEEAVVVPAKFDKVLTFLFTGIPTPTMSTTWVLLRNQYITNPASFRLMGEGHYSKDDTEPHITVRVETPYLHSKTGEVAKSWVTFLHIYYTEIGAGKRKYTYITLALDGVKQLVAEYGI